MITRKEHRKVIALEEEKREIKSLLDSFESPHVKASVGIADINSANKHDPKKSDHAQFFHRDFAALVEELNKRVIERLKHRVKEIELELSRHISDYGKS